MTDYLIWEDDRHYRGKGHDKDGYFVITLEEFFADGTPPKYEKTYYEPFEKEGDEK